MNSVTLDKNIHNRKEFNCGNKELNNFLRLTASQNSNKDNSRTYLIESIDNNSIIKGFYTLSMISIELNLLSNKLEKKHKSNNSAGLIARLAVDNRYKRKGLGSWLLIDALLKLLNASDNVGFGMIVVDVKDGKKSFYEKFGFQSFKDEKERMYISVDTVRQSFSK